LLIVATAGLEVFQVEDAVRSLLTNSVPSCGVLSGRCELSCSPYGDGDPGAASDVNLREYRLISLRRH
jgi:hypothetical protein